MNKLQLSMFLTNQILVIKSGMELTAQVKKFRVAFKEMVGLPKRASHLQVLGAIREVYIANGIEAEFIEKIKRHKAEHLLEALV
jgi:hypothetical protein